MTTVTRRSALRLGTVAAAGLGALPLTKVAAAAAEPTSVRGAFEYQHAPVALPFDATRLKGLSEKLLRSHWENNYGGAVAALNTVRRRLALADSATPAYVYNGLKREQLLRTGSVVLHELYFQNLGGDGRASSDLRSRLTTSFGSFDNWESEFRRIGAGLGGGSGWVVLGYNQQLQLLENYWLADHATVPVHTRPLLVMDMYEHAYHMDYGAAAARYIDAFFANINWDAVAGRW